MLGKLMKYDLKWIYKAVVVFYILSLIFSLLTRGFNSIENSSLFNILGKISAGIAISMIISSLINCLMRSWARFIRNIYKDESYLTHTLPVPKKTVYLSKVLSGVICIFTTVLVGILCLAICYYSKDNFDVLKDLLKITADNYDTSVLKLLVVVSVVFFFEVVFFLLTGYVGIILGFKSNKSKIVKTLVYSFIIYFVSEGVILAAVFGIGLFSSDIMSLFTSSEAISADALKTVMYAIIVIYLVINTVFYFIGKRQLEKGVNVD